MSEIPMPEDREYHTSDDRPLGITILGFLQVIAGVFMVVVGALIMIIPIIGWIIGGLLLILGLVSFYVGNGLLNLEEWAWQWAFIINIISIIIGIAGQNWGGVIISIIILIYLNQENIKRRFNR
ncbi:MAG: conserved membrane protein of unknown function [Candidatus Thorarchaeota archaeon]|nr:MAG: conserved membrane protein of unknown function [Candidatus Thorarchaeota archaeon]